MVGDMTMQTRLLKTFLALREFTEKDADKLTLAETALLNLASTALSDLLDSLEDRGVE